MDLAKWEPLTDIQSILDRTLSWPGVRIASPSSLDIGPRVDIFESDSQYQIKADVPGLQKQDITVSLSGNRLTIQGERTLEDRELRPRFHRLERAYGSFCRSFSLPDDVNTAEISATCEHGELTVTIAKHDVSQIEEDRPVPVN
ncbi:MULTISPECIES: Hsp20/alpha crystallin family protein [unclassified Synechococcus]|uniref:Hsp20/alpha crystallin family protein n=1 Tax=unclassified Synechococcus TaxID=2626047 RepID=UPI00200167D1|nr:Hsp20/alpha crystallin family protein [Synechococcus sp. A10-1-5-1]UPM50862.1 Hsp20/alpha crystallin family protein [Synechococcus sp. A10-1-5-1]